MSDAETRDGFRHFLEIPTRWGDNDSYGHVNNVVYYAFFDTAVNRYLVEQGALDVGASPVFGVVVETQCRFHEPAAFPEVLEAGLRVARVGTSSVRWEIGIFRRAGARAIASGHFVHVYVDRITRRPAAIPGPARAAVERLVAPA
jgi:acyl-CoA thioester hydrolase